MNVSEPDSTESSSLAVTFVGAYADVAADEQGAALRRLKETGPALEDEIASQVELDRLAVHVRVTFATGSITWQVLAEIVAAGSVVRDTAETLVIAAGTIEVIRRIGNAINKAVKKALTKVLGRAVKLPGSATQVRSIVPTSSHDELIKLRERTARQESELRNLHETIPLLTQIILDHHDRFVGIRGRLDQNATAIERLEDGALGQRAVASRTVTTDELMDGLRRLRILKGTTDV